MEMKKKDKERLYNDRLIHQCIIISIAKERGR